MRTWPIAVWKAKEEMMANLIDIEEKTTGSEPQPTPYEHVGTAELPAGSVVGVQDVTVPPGPLDRQFTVEVEVNEDTDPAGVAEELLQRAVDEAGGIGLVSRPRQEPALHIATSVTLCRELLMRLTPIERCEVMDGLCVGCGAELEEDEDQYLCDECEEIEDDGDDSSSEEEPEGSAGEVSEATGSEPGPSESED